MIIMGALEGNRLQEKAKVPVREMPIMNFYHPQMLKTHLHNFEL